MNRKNNNTLFVDLDGTLIFSDLLVESALELIKRNLLYIFLLPFWLLRGRAWFKHQIAQRVSLRVDLLPYNKALLLHLKEQKALGSKLVLISASNQQLVEQVAAHTALFDEAIGSSATLNCSGRNKLALINRVNGEHSFDYAGNANVDLQIWTAADNAILVNANSRLTRKAKAVTKVTATFDNGFNSLGGKLDRCLKAMRPHQWLKNILLFLPLILSHQLDSPTLIIQVLTGFVCFSLCASSVYLLNDLLDLSADRQHRSKCNRPLASGDMPIHLGLILSPALLILAFAIATQLPVEFFFVLALYYFLTCFYSFVLKKIELVDVITLATLYTLRIIAGAAAVSIIPSFWLLAFSMFLFMSLAMVKRYAELSHLNSSGITHSEGRGYLSKDLDILAVFGCTSGLLSVMVFALYINSDDIVLLYITPEILWFICPLLLYLVSRIWLLAARNQIEEDPVVFALQDGISQAVTLVCGILLWMANLNWQI